MSDDGRFYFGIWFRGRLPGSSYLRSVPYCFTGIIIGKLAVGWLTTDRGKDS